jgi:hypothetical protein
MCTLVVWVNHNSKERLTKPQLHAVSGRIAKMTSNVNTTGYSRPKDDAAYARGAAGANALELGAFFKSLFSRRHAVTNEAKRA